MRQRRRLGVLLHLERANHESRHATPTGFYHLHLLIEDLRATLARLARNRRRAVRVRLDVTQEDGEQVEIVLAANGTFVSRVRGTAVDDAPARDVILFEVHHRQLRSGRIRPASYWDRDVGVVRYWVSIERRYPKSTSVHFNPLGGRRSSK